MIGAKAAVHRRALLRRYAGRFALLTILSTAASLLEAITLVSVAPLGQLLATGDDSFRGSIGPFTVSAERSSLLLFAAATLVGSVAFQIAAGFTRASMLSAHELDSRRTLFGHFLCQTWESATHEPAGALQTEFQDFISRGNQYLGSASSAMRSLTAIGSFVGSALVVDPPFAIAMFVLGGGLFVLFRPFSTFGRRREMILARTQRLVGAEVAEAVAGFQAIKVFGAETALAARMDRLLSAAWSARRSQERVLGMVQPLYRGFGIVLILATLALAARFGTDVTTLGAIGLVLLRSVTFGQALQVDLQRLAQTGAYVDQVAGSIANRAGAADARGGEHLSGVARVVLIDVSYRYPKEGANSGDDFSLRLPARVELGAGEMIGLVGRSGSGKSTLAQLLLGLRSPTSGDIQVNEKSLASYSRESWIKQTSFVPQSPRLLLGSVIDNVSYGRTDIDRAAAEAALEQAGILAEMRALPDGLETRLGYGVRELSGGQLQRLALARSLVGRPSLVVLDEPTSALDDQSELIVTRAISTLPEPTLRVVIAHRLSTLKLCTRVIVLDKGRIIEDGDPASVLAAYRDQLAEVGLS